MVLTDLVLSDILRAVHGEKLPSSPILASFDEAPPYIPQIAVATPRPLRLSLLLHIQARPQIQSPQVRCPVECALALLAHVVRKALPCEPERVRVGLDRCHDGVGHARSEEARECRCVGVPLCERRRERFV